MSTPENAFILGFGIGGIAAAFIISISSPSLRDTRADYRKCLALQAPQEVCLKTYLLPPEDK